MTSSEAAAPSQRRRESRVEVEDFIQEQKRLIDDERKGIEDTPSLDFASTDKFPSISERPKRFPLRSRRMRPNTPDAAFEGGGLFAKLGAHAEISRRLQEQRRREYNDIMAAKSAPKNNVTDSQKLNLMLGRNERGSGREGREDNEDDGGNLGRSKKRFPDNSGGHRRDRSPGSQVKSRRNDADIEDDDVVDGTAVKSAWKDANGIVEESKRRWKNRREEDRHRVAKEDRLWDDDDIDHLRRERERLRSQSAPNGFFEPEVSVSRLPLIGERDTRSADFRKKEEYRKELERQIAEQRLRRRAEDDDDQRFPSMRLNSDRERERRRRTGSPPSSPSDGNFESRNSRGRPREEKSPTRRTSHHHLPPQQAQQPSLEGYQPPPGYALVPTFSNFPQITSPQLVSPMLHPAWQAAMQHQPYVSPYSLSQMPVPSLAPMINSPEAVLTSQHISPIQAALHINQRAYEDLDKRIKESAELRESESCKAIYPEARESSTNTKEETLNSEKYSKPPEAISYVSKKTLRQDEYRLALQDQIRFKEEERRRARAAEEREDERMERERQGWNPWGKGGAGAPLRDAAGRIVAELGRMKAKPLEKETWEDKMSNLEVERTNESHRSRQGDETGRSEATALAAADELASPVETENEGFARGGNGIFGTPKSSEEKENIASYQETLRLQIEERRKKQKEEKDRRLREEEEESRKIEEQRKKMEEEYAAEQRKERAKEEETRRRNEEIKKQMEERQKEAERKRKEELEKRREEEAKIREEELRARMRDRSPPPVGRSISPPIPTFRKAGIAVAAVAALQSSADGESAVDRHAASLNGPRTNGGHEAAATKNSTMDEGAADPDAEFSSHQLLRQLSSMRLQLKREKERVEQKLAHNNSKNHHQKLPLSALMNLPVDQRMDFIMDQVQGQKPIKVQRGNSVSDDRSSNPLATRSLLDASSDFIPVDAPLSEDIFDNNELSARDAPGGQKNKRPRDLPSPNSFPEN